MMGHGTIGLAALLATSALGYFVCSKANTEKKGSVIRTIGLGVGSLIIILSILGSLCVVAQKCGYACPLTKKWISQKCSMMRGQMGQQPGMPSQK